MFLRFPIRNKVIKEKWIKVIRVSRNEPSWNPTVRSVVCSIHFADEDFYKTNKGLRRVVQNGYPKHIPATPIETIDVDSLQPCSSQAHVSGTPILSSTPIPYIEKDSESIFDTPMKHKLRQRIFRLENKLNQMKTKIKTLNQKVRRLKERNNSLKKIIENMKKKHYIDTDLYNSLHANIAAVDIFNALNRKKLEKNIKYTPAMKKFCLTLNNYSSKAYQYVRCTFGTCLPHPKTLAKWCVHIKGKPGFTEEGSQALKAETQVSEHTENLRNL